MLDFDTKKRDDLSVIAESAGLGNITKSSLEKSLTQFRKEIKSFKKMAFNTDPSSPYGRTKNKALKMRTFFFGPPYRARTCHLQNRNLTLYPDGLRVEICAE